MRECMCQAPHRAKWSNRGALAALFHRFSAFESHLFQSAHPVCVYMCGFPKAQSSSVLCCGPGRELKAEEGGAGTGGRGERCWGRGREWCQRAPEQQGTPPDPSCPCLAAAYKQVPGFSGLPGGIPAVGWEEEVNCQENAKNNVWAYIKLISRVRQC